MSYMTSMTSYFSLQFPLPRGQFDLELGSNIANCTVDLATLVEILTTNLGRPCLIERTLLWS